MTTETRARPAQTPTPIPPADETPPAEPVRRSDEQIFVRNGIPIQIGGATRYLPVLPRRATREWRERFQVELQAMWTGIQGLEGNASGTAALFDLAAGIGDRAFDLVVAYDRDEALGGVEYLEAHATDPEIWEAAKAIAGYVFPFAKDLGRFPTLLDQLLEVAGRSGSSTASPSTTGG